MISQKMRVNLSGGSMIRKMFEEGNRLRALYGAENVFDFSLGNPDGEPPQETLDAMRALVDEPGIHQYMPNAGFPEVRATMAAYENRRAGLEIPAANVVMTVGAACGLSIALRALLDPGDEVLVLAPYFVEYLHYIRNSDGVPVIVPTNDAFRPDPEAVKAAITARTRAIIINSPHNPTGVVYTREDLKALNAALLEGAAAAGLAEPICVISDEPYARLTYGAEVPAVLAIFDTCMVVNSFSKSLALPGERIGYLAVSPKVPEADQVVAAAVFALRTLGFVNAPGLLQKAAAASLEAPVPVAEYQARRDLLHGILTEAGFECALPDGAFYLFMKTPIEDDMAFVDEAAKENILLVPGSGFGRKGYVRLAYCVSREVIARSREAFLRLGARYR